MCKFSLVRFNWKHSKDCQYCFCVTLRLSSASNNQPNQEGLRNKREDLVDLLAVVVAAVAHVGVQRVAPASNLRILKVHVDGERVEHDKICAQNSPDKSRYFTNVGWNRYGGENNCPWYDSCKTSVEEGWPVDFIVTSLSQDWVLLFEEKAKKIHACVNSKNCDKSHDIINAEEHRDQGNHDAAAESILKPPEFVDAFAKILCVGVEIKNDDSVEKSAQEWKAWAYCCEW